MQMLGGTRNFFYLASNQWWRGNEREQSGGQMFCVQETGGEKHICGLNYGTFMHMVENMLETDRSG